MEEGNSMFGSLIEHFLAVRAAGAQQSLIVIACLLILGGLQVPAAGSTLAELFNGGFVDVGACRFDNWVLNSLDATAAQSPLLSQISVVPLVDDLLHPGLRYAANEQLSTSGINAIDLTFTYRVQSLSNANSFVGDELGLTGITFGGAGGIAFLSQEVANQGGGDLGSTLVIADNESDFFQFADNSAFAPQFNLSVATNVFITGLSATDVVDMSTFIQRFSQTGPQRSPGDFDLDGDVDGNDFLAWQRGGSPTPLSVSELADWRANFGTVASLAATSTTVPEPGSLWLPIIGLLAMLSRRVAA
jgi:hypothetical protein